MTPRQFLAGQFVRCKKSGAFGKLLARTTSGWDVRFFYGPTDVERRTCRSAELESADLWHRALVFGSVSWGDRQRPGRVMGMSDATGRRRYDVQFAAGPREFVDAENLDVLSPDAVIDVAGLLGAGAFEGPTIHDRRLMAMRALIGLRAAARGHAGLLSASVELLPHQIEIVARILDDPIQRYLLADEVGLGKTIEAGIILRQFLIDDPKSRGVILVGHAAFR